MVVKVSFNLPDVVVQAAKELAAERGTSVTEVVRDSISNEVFLSREVENGSKVLIQGPDHSYREMLFPGIRKQSAR